MPVPHPATRRRGAELLSEPDPASGDALSDVGYDDLPDAVVVVGMRGQMLRANPAARRLLGLGTDPVGRPVSEVLPLTEIDGRDWWTCLRPYDGLDTRTRQPERLLTLADARGSRQLYVTARFVRGAGRRVHRLVIALRETTIRDRAERNRADLVSTVAHELRSPLTSIKGFTATLLAKWDQFSDEQKQLMLMTVNSDADRVTRLITELLDVSRIESGRLELHRQVVDPFDLVERVFAGQVAAGEPAARFVLEKEGALPELWLDPDKMLQVLGNLVENAVRHGSGTVVVAVRPEERGGRDSAGSSASGVVVTVADHGDGVPPEMLSRLFGKFTRGAQRGSTGLGLFIVRGIVEAHGGTIEVGRSLSGGAEFRFTVPPGTPSFL